MYNFSIYISSPNDKTYGINNLELDDGIFGKPLYALNCIEIEEIRNKLIFSLKKIVLYTLNSTENYEQTLRNAHLLNIEYLKLKTYDEKFAVSAKLFDIKTIIEDIGDYPNIIFNPSNFVKQHMNPYLTVLYKNKYKDRISFLRINDSLYNNSEPKLPEKGNSEIKECASNLLSRSFQGYFSIKKYGDFSESDIIKAFCSTLTLM